MKHLKIRNLGRLNAGLENLELMKPMGWDVMAIASRSDGFLFILAKNEGRFRGEPRITAGCHHWVTLKWYRRHVRTERNWSYPRGKRAETTAILDLFEKKMKLAWSNRTI